MFAREVTDDRDGFSNNLIPCSRETLPFSIRDLRHDMANGSDDTGSGTVILDSFSRQSRFPESGIISAAMCIDTERHVIRIV